MLKTGLKLPGIDRIFLLNLRHRTDRLRFQKNQFLDLGIESFVRIEPVAVFNSGKFLNKSIKSVYLSHLKIIKQALDENITALILEDDARIKDFSKVKTCLNFLFNEFEDWDIFYLYNCSMFYKNKLDNFVELRGPVVKLKHCLEMHAYIINKNKLSFVYNILNNFKNKIEQSERKCDWRSHCDQVFVHDIHPFCNVYGCPNNLIAQNRSQFKSDNNWTLPD